MSYKYIFQSLSRNNTDVSGRIGVNLLVAYLNNHLDELSQSGVSDTMFVRMKQREWLTPSANRKQ